MANVITSPQSVITTGFPNQTFIANVGIFARQALLRA
jgi:hypothetical protein